MVKGAGLQVVVALLESALLRFKHCEIERHLEKAGFHLRLPCFFCFGSRSRITPILVSCLVTQKDRVRLPTICIQRKFHLNVPSNLITCYSHILLCVLYRPLQILLPGKWSHLVVILESYSSLADIALHGLAHWTGKTIIFLWSLFANTIERSYKGAGTSTLRPCVMPLAKRSLALINLAAALDSLVRKRVVINFGLGVRVLTQLSVFAVSNSPVGHKALVNTGNW